MDKKRPILEIHDIHIYIYIYIYIVTLLLFQYDYNATVSPADKSGGIVMMYKQKYVDKINSLQEDINSYDIYIYIYIYYEVPTISF